MGPRPVADSYGGYRAKLVEHLRGRGIEDLAVLRAFAEVPRHRFVPDALLRQAYEDTSLPIGSGQTISQPSTQARYLQAMGLTGRERVLEVGTGSGYQAALLSYLCEQVTTVERIPSLAETARLALSTAGISNVLVVTADGSLGWRPNAPYDAVLVAAAGPDVPPPLLEQLREGGRLVMPVTSSGTGDTEQRLVRITRHAGRLTREELGAVQFVPLIGHHGFSTEP